MFASLYYGMAIFLPFDFETEKRICTSLIIVNTHILEHHNVSIISLNDTIITEVRRCYCPCDKVHPERVFNDSEKKQILDAHVKELTVDKKKLSSALRKKISAKDDRPSSTAFGGLGIILLIVAAGVLIFFDYTILRAHITMLYHNIKAMLGRE